jgi:hypothetical protein
MTERPPPPDFVIGGAQKAGTTSLWEYMNTHPDICMAWLKEPRYFVRGAGATRRRATQLDLPGNYERGAEWYRALFGHCSPGAVRGEGTPMYLRAPEAPELMRNDAPHARVIFVLRDPVSRLHSQYQHQRRFFRLPPFEQMVAEGHPALERFLNGSRYGLHLSRWHEHFAPDRILVFLTEDLGDTLAVVRKAFRFVGVDDAFVPPNIDRRYNEAYVGRIPALNRLVRNRLPGLPVPVARAVRALADPIRRLNVRREETAPVDEGVRAELIGRLAEDIDRTEQLTGRDLSAWRTAAPAQR